MVSPEEDLVEPTTAETKAESDNAVARKVDEHGEDGGIEVADGEETDAEVEGEDDMTDAEAMMLYRQIEAEKRSVVGSVRLAATRNMVQSRLNGEKGGDLNAPDDASVSELVSALTHVMLDRECLSSLDDGLLSCLGQCTHIHLQRNRLTDLSFVPRIGMPVANDVQEDESDGRAHNCVQYMLLSHNELSSLEGVESCEQLVFLDVSHNKLRDIDPQHLPRSLQYFNIAGNPCTEDTGTVASV